MSLPTLPTKTILTAKLADVWGYTPAQMQAYGQQCRDAALEEAAAAVEKATCRNRWAKAAVNSHPDDVPPCEFAALIRAMKETTP